MVDRRKNIPWVEKYRPTNIENIVLTEENKKILKSIIKTNHFPNLLLHGPPGTGKTTTIVNFIKVYQKEYNQQSVDLIIHLNASDDRGIDVIRNQINSFVNSSSLFVRGTKFVVLDEVDYMTETAQYGLRSLIQSTSAQNVRYCLLCNYISRVVDVLHSEFVCLKYDQLPIPEINTFLHSVALSENIPLTDDFLDYLHLTFRSDIRSMVNCMQLYNTKGVINNNQLITPQILNNMCGIIVNVDISLKDTLLHVDKYIIDHNLDLLAFFCLVINHFIRNYPTHITETFLSSLENVFQEGNSLELFHVAFVVQKIRKSITV